MSTLRIFLFGLGSLVLGAPATLVQATIRYQDPLTSPVTYAAGNVKWTSTIKRARRALKSVATQWVVLTGLKRHGFPGDSAVFNLPVATQPDVPGMVAEKVPFTTDTSRVLPESLEWWGPNDQPGTLTAAAARAASPTSRIARRRGRCALASVCNSYLSGRCKYDALKGVRNAPIPSCTRWPR